MTARYYALDILFRRAFMRAAAAFRHYDYH